MLHDPKSNSDYTRRVASISSILREHDPAYIGPDMPEDEYDPEAAAILARAKDASDPEKLAVVIANVLAEAFDEWTGSRSLRDTELALRIWSVLHASNP